METNQKAKAEKIAKLDCHGNFYGGTHATMTLRKVR